MILMFVIAVLLTSTAMAYAEFEATLWLPEKMIMGEAYHGMILVDHATPEGLLMLLSAGDEHIIGVPDSVPIRPYQNHGVFQITPLSKGITDVFATAGNAGLKSASVEVISPQSEPASLQIVPAASKTLADSMLAYVMVLDEGGSPIKANKNLDVHLATSSSIGASGSLVIQNGTHYSWIEIDVRGTGSMTASADGLKPHTVEIQRVQDEIAIKVAIAPDIAMQDSYVHYFVWLEKDGRPFEAPHVVDVFLHSGNPDSARFTAGSSHDESGVMVRMVDGVAKGILYTGERGPVTITASTTEFGSGRDSIFVGPARVDVGGTDTVLISQQNLVNDENDFSDSPDPNLLLSWIYPSVTDSVAWVVVATYSADKTRIIGMDADDPANVLEDTVITPTRLDGRSVIHVSSNGGIVHDGAYRIEETLTKTNAVEFEISGASHGDHSLTISGEGLEAAGAKVSIVPEYSEKFKLGITPIPVAPNSVQDIAMVSVFDESGSMVDVGETFGTRAEFVVHSDSARVYDDATLPERSNSVVVRGALVGTSHMTALLDGVDSASAELTPARTAISLEILAPSKVHIDEAFPFVVHHVDHAGNPVSIAENPRISSALDVSADGGFMTVRDPGNGKVSVISGIGASEHDITGIANTMSVDLNFDRDSLRVGKDIVLEVASSVDASYELFADFPFVQTGGSTFVITPDREDDDALFTLLATREGYEPVTISETLDVQRIFTVDVWAEDSGGSRLAIPFDLYLDGEQSQAHSPYRGDHRPGQLAIDLPEKHTVHGYGYGIKGVVINGQERGYEGILDVALEQDVTIEATYAREILVSANGGLGSGVYEHGDAVTIDAPDRDKVSFLIRDVFNHWEGNNVNGNVARQTFVATQDVNVTAIYREDYTYLMVIIAAPLLAVGVLVMYRNTAGFRWGFENLLEKTVGMTSPQKFKNNLKSKKAKPERASQT